MPKSGDFTYGLSRFFSSLYGKRSPLGVLAVSLVSVNQRRSYPIVMEQILRDDSSLNPGVSTQEQRDDTETAAKLKRGCPKEAETGTRMIWSHRYAETTSNDG